MTTSEAAIYDATSAEPCPTCGFRLSPTAHGWLDAGTVPGQQQLVPCPTCSPAVKATRLQQRIARMGMGAMPEYASTWDWASLLAQDGLSASQRAAIDLAQQFAAMAAGVATGEPGAKRGLYLWGEFGRGKSSIALCILRDALYEGRPAAYVRTVELFAALRQAIGNHDNKMADEYMRLVSDAEVLVLDDLAVERPSAWVLEQLYMVLERRFSARERYTIVTSNRSLQGLDLLWLDEYASENDEMQARRIVQRLGRHCQVVEVEGRNLALRHPARDGYEGDEPEGEEA